MKKILAWTIILVVVFFFFKAWWNSQLSSVSKEIQEKKVIIPKGSSLSFIVKKLKEEHLIRSEVIFSLYTKQQGLGNKLSAGTFNLSPSMSVPEIIKNLLGKPSENWVTLIEGWRIEEMAKKLSDELGVDSKELLKNSKEGYMFPDTYLFSQEVSVSQITQKLKDTFNERYSEGLKNKIKAQGLTEGQGVILASIVEREGRSDVVRTEVASILLKRLKIDMGLNVDATLQYILGYQPSENSWWKRNLSKEDKKIDSPYNTYLYKGLPPAPICSPGLSSLTAVANADSNTPYLYYYHDSKGNSHPAKTLEEHNANVANYP